MKIISALILLIQSVLAVAQTKSTGYETLVLTNEYQARFRYVNTNIASQPTYFNFTMYYFDNRDFSVSLSDTLVIYLYKQITGVEKLISTVKMLPIAAKSACYGCGVPKVPVDTIIHIPGTIKIPGNTIYNGVYILNDSIFPYRLQMLTNLRDDVAKKAVGVLYTLAPNQADIIQFVDQSGSERARIEIKIRNSNGVYKTTCDFAERIWLGGATLLTVPH